ncbi:MAG: hypothetical protein NXH73_07250 [Flavobacteriaceae bacterium]|nr:hypothetical protein [Flavobacteriaceae bacterium]
MQTIRILQTDYVHHANRTIETLLIGGSKKLYIYNHQGQYFKVFTSSTDINNYLNGQKVKILAEFIEEVEMDNFLLTLEYEMR